MVVKTKYYNSLTFHQTNIALDAISNGIENTSTKYLIPSHITKYYKSKLLNPNLHSHSHGGKRNIKYNESIIILIKIILTLLAQENSTLNVEQICTLLNSALVLPKPIQSWNVRGLLKELGLFFKIPSQFQHHKFTENNMLYYQIYFPIVQHLPLRKIKYLDESHFCPKHLQKKKVLGFKGK